MHDEGEDPTAAIVPNNAHPDIDDTPSAIPPPAPSQPAPVLSVAEAAELAHLARKIRKHHFENTGGSLPVLLPCASYLKSPDLVPVKRQHALLRRLRMWWFDCRRANAMAQHLGWSKESLVPVRAEEWPLPHGIGEMTEAEQAGVPILTEFKPESSISRWSLAPGSWLAMAWREAGRPQVTMEQWVAALRSTSHIELVDESIAASAITI
uniref:Uncharacterized protein n=1 Tax=Mycena chlorophos TaxID=658473 RepID=A0ABQ0M2C5_MYCCL|nr:predicted protein [Mycena chlorophos]